MSNRKWIFVDHENVGHLEKFDIASIEKLYVFVGATHKALKIGFIGLNHGLSIEVIKIKEIGNNNLDFHLAFYLGKLDVTEDPEIEFIILSKDKGFDHLIQFINERGRNCRRVTKESLCINSPVTPKTSAKANSPIEDKLKAAKEKPLPAPIPNDIRNKVSHVIENLRKVPGKQRPRKLKTLKNQIKNIEKGFENEILQQLQASGIVKETANSLVYSLESAATPINDKSEIEGFRELCKNLKKMDGNKRPRKLKTLINHIKAFRKGNHEALFQTLKSKQMIKLISGDKVKYHL